MYNQNKKLMKTIFILFITLFAHSCTSDNDSSTAAVNDNFIRAKVNSVSYEASGSELHGSIEETGFDLDSRNTNRTGMDFYIVGEINVGTYTFSTSNVTTQGRLNYRLSGENFTTGFCSVSNGSLTITSINGKVYEGTFSFTGSSMSVSCATPSTTTVTEGTFKVTVP
jgi:hypothetical protein